MNNAMPSIDISPEHWKIVQGILQQYVPNYAVWAFGSRVTGKAKPYSDLDLAMVSDKPMLLIELADLKEAFVESDLPWKVDIVDWATTSTDFKKIIQQNYVVVQSAFTDQAAKSSD